MVGWKQNCKTKVIILYSLMWTFHFCVATFPHRQHTEYIAPSWYNFPELPGIISFQKIAAHYETTKQIVPSGEVEIKQTIFGGLRVAYSLVFYVVVEFCGLSIGLLFFKRWRCQLIFDLWVWMSLWYLTPLSLTYTKDLIISFCS